MGSIIFSPQGFNPDRFSTLSLLYCTSVWAAWQVQNKTSFSNSISLWKCALLCCTKILCHISSVKLEKKGRVFFTLTLNTFWDSKRFLHISANFGEAGLKLLITIILFIATSIVASVVVVAALCHRRDTNVKLWRKSPHANSIGIPVKKDTAYE